jgi:chemotaxis protein histidine kinase CheA
MANIAIQSSLGKGTTFNITLPLSGRYSEQTSIENRA